MRRYIPNMSNSYAQWRLRAGILPALHEGPETPSERLLQMIWFNQRLLRDRFVTLDGRRVQVLHPGFWNHESGPDFNRAVLQFDAEAPSTGDVEIDLAAGGWQAHKHHSNPAYEKVILHVVWEGAARTSLPTLALKGLLDSPVGELAQWLGDEPSFPGALTGGCCAPLGQLAPDQLSELLRQAALVRLRSKAAQFQARARQAGWEQALWEGLFRGLGYKRNLWPMQRLAELRPRWTQEGSALDASMLEARLLGIASLLPNDLTRGESGTDVYLRAIWDYWWRERERFSDCLLPERLWHFSGLRPANHPQRRLALAARWLERGDLMARLEKWCALTVEPEHLVETLLAELRVAEVDFWSRHWTVRSPRLPKPQAMIGAARVTDLAVNVILPWLWMRAVEGKSQRLQEELERRYLAWPSAQDNAVLRLARYRLFGGLKARRLSGAAAQQGLLQVVRDFCEHSNSLCADCPFPELVRQWQP